MTHDIASSQTSTTLTSNTKWFTYTCKFTGVQIHMQVHTQRFTDTCKFTHKAESKFTDTWGSQAEPPPFASCAHCMASRIDLFASCAHCRAVKWQHRNGGFLFSRLLFLFTLCLDWSSSRRRFIWIWYWPVYGRTRFEQETTSNSSNKVTAELDLPERVVYVAPDIWCRRLLHYWQWQTSSSIRETGSWEQIILLTWIPYQMRPRKSRFQ